VLLIEDSPTDVEITRRAMMRARAPVTLAVARDGEEAIDYLFHRVPSGDAPRPHLVLLDLNLPRIHGHEVLRRIKDDPDLKMIPVIVFSTSDADEDVAKTYKLGVNSYFSKPTEFLAYRRLLSDVERYWTQLVKLPG
jgi:CheY-like chemotaxis protein